MGAYTANHDIGTTAILIGAVDEILGFEGNELVVKDGSYAQQLKNTLSLASLDGYDLKAVVSVNAQDKPKAALRFGYGYQVSAISNDTCRMMDWLSDNEITVDQFKHLGILATAAGASWPLLLENAFDDEYFDTLIYLASLSNVLHAGDPVETRKGVFMDLSNSLEDALGAVIAVTMGIEYLNCSSDATLLAPAPMSYSRTRIGPNSPLSYLFLLPPIFNLGIVGWLFWSSVKPQRRS